MQLSLSLQLYFLHCKFIFHLEYQNPSVQLVSLAKFKNHAKKKQSFSTNMHGLWVFTVIRIPSSIDIKWLSLHPTLLIFFTTVYNIYIYRHSIFLYRILLHNYDLPKTVIRLSNNHPSPITANCNPFNPPPPPTLYM